MVEFRRRVAEIEERAEASYFDIAQFEDRLEDLLRFMWTHPKATPAFKAEFLRLLERKAAGVEEIVGFCMHSLRWPELREAIREKRDAIPARSAGRLWEERRYWEKLLEAFEDEWPNAVLYRRYSDG